MECLTIGFIIPIIKFVFVQYNQNLNLKEAYNVLIVLTFITCFQNIAVLTHVPYVTNVVKCYENIYLGISSETNIVLDTSVEGYIA